MTIGNIICGANTPKVKKKKIKVYFVIKDIYFVFIYQRYLMFQIYYN